MSIVRIDSDAHSTHGWQVRIHHARHTKFFSDGRFGGADAAEKAARQYHDTYLRQHPPEYARSGPRPRRQSNNTSGINGVHYSFTRWRGERTRRWYWAASYRNERGEPRNRRFYVQTHGFDGAKKLAIAFRRAWEAQQREKKAA